MSSGTTRRAPSAGLASRFAWWKRGWDWAKPHPPDRPVRF